MSYMTSKPKNPTRDQLVAWLKQTGGCGLLPADFSTRCPKRGGPANPNVEHPGRVGFPGENGFCTCSGCEHFLGLDWNSYVCKHPSARAVAARALAERIREWEEEQAQVANVPQKPGPKVRPQAPLPSSSPDPPQREGPTQLTMF